MTHEHSADGADYCFGCKMLYMRQNRTIAITYSGGRETFHNEPSVYQREKDRVKELTDAGVSFDRARPAT